MKTNTTAIIAIVAIVFVVFLSFYSHSITHSYSRTDLSGQASRILKVSTINDEKSVFAKEILCRTPNNEVYISKVGCKEGEATIPLPN